MQMDRDKSSSVKSKNQKLKNISNLYEDPNIVEFLKNRKKKLPSSEIKLECKDENNSSEKKNKTLTNINSESEICTEKTKDNESSINIEDEKLPIKPSETKKWVHMDIVEKEKLAWMSDLPPPKLTDPKTGYIARFDFKGNLISHDQDIPTFQGLHHHGEEPEVPGYSMEELYILLRSSFQSQRVLSLETLAHILKNNAQGWFDECLQHSLMKELLSSGLVPLLRWSLDDNSESLLATAVHAIRNLIYNDYDEICLDLTFTWKGGHINPFLIPVKQENLTENKLEEMADIEILKFDVIKGLLRMDLLPRLRYILEICHPPASVIGHIFDILIRIGRHSLESSVRIFECPRLLNIITTEFLPTNWKFAEIVQGQQCNAYGFPSRSAVKLIRILSLSGYNIASRLIADFGIINSLCCYITMDPSDDKLSQSEAFALVNEAMRALKVLLTYNLAVQEYIDIFPVFIQKLHYCHSLDVTVQKNLNDFEFASILFLIFETTVNIISERNLNEYYPLNWNSVTELYKFTETYCKKWFWQLTSGQECTNMLASVMIGSCLNFISNYYRQIIKSTLNAVDILQTIEIFVEQHIAPFIKSRNFKKYVKDLSKYSIILCDKSSGSKRDESELPSLGGVMWGAEIVPLLKEGTPFPLLISVVNLLYVIRSVHPDCLKMTEEFIYDSDFMHYVHQIIEKKKFKRIEWFWRHEINFLSIVILLNAKMECHPIYYNLSFKLLPHINVNDGWLSNELMNYVIFSSKYFSDLNGLEKKLEILEINDDKISIKSVTGEIIETNHIQLIEKTLQRLPSVLSTYVDFFFDKNHLEKSRCRMEENGMKINSLCIEVFASHIIDRDWPFSPIRKLYKETKSQNYKQNAKTTAIVQHCLQWCHLLQCWKPNIAKLIPAGIQFYNLASMFLIDNDIFFDCEIQKYYCACLHQLLKNNHKKNWKLEKLNCPGIGSFSDLYSELLIQFESSSYGDKLFGNTIIIPLQQCYDSYWKKQLFTEHIGILKILRISFSEILVSLDNYLNPPETDEDLLSMYAKNLLSGSLQEKYCPLLYKMALHHLGHHFRKYDYEEHFKLLSKLLNINKVSCARQRLPVAY
ncbi:RNA polymerase II-associated protein 1-like isoform X2 [Centruroides vittatus]|uniref:RNA polymerase II-associated protein 1-like isoform X2 n=1 Tax=Centruroides vittatus TaxID=120091 RepID=UPI0035107636